VLRLNPDGSTPSDQANASPMYAGGFHAPRAIAWAASPDVVWVVERRGTLSAIEADRTRADRKKRGVTGRQYRLPNAVEPASMAFRDDDLLIATADGSLLRARIDVQQPAAIAGIEPLLREPIPALRIVGVGLDRTIYVATDTAIARLIPMIGSR
jgi:hypothetical protein